jgi:NAD(P)-dependent dehydrogenase (short-subunit alcohol dehydrogenase family)
MGTGQPLAGQVAVVTGAGRGIGAAIASRLAALGATAVLCGRTQSTLDATARSILDAGGKVEVIACDVTVLHQLEYTAARVDTTYGRLDILVNNAGVAPDNPAEKVREQDFDLTLAVNLKGTFFASQAAGRVMIRQTSGRIINISSQAGFVALPTESIYCMTKAAISHLTKCLAIEWGKYNITVNAVAPTFIHTPGTQEYLANPESRADVIERVAALHRIGEPMEVAGAVVFLASNAASLITGDTILIDGGWTAR